MGRKQIDIHNKAITKTVSLTPEQLNNIIAIYGTLTKGVQHLANQASLTLQTINPNK